MVFFKPKETKTNDIDEKLKDLLLSDEIIETHTSGVTDHVVLTNKRIIVLSVNIKESSETYISIPYRTVCSIDIVKNKAKLTNIGDILVITVLNKNIAVNVNDPISLSKMIMSKII